MYWSGVYGIAPGVRPSPPSHGYGSWPQSHGPWQRTSPVAPSRPSRAPFWCQWSAPDSHVCDADTEPVAVTVDVTEPEAVDETAHGQS